MVASGNIGKAILLEQFASKYQSLFTPETFCGLTYGIQHLKVTCLLYHTGKLVLTRAKNEQQLNDAYIHMNKLLTKFGFSKRSLIILLKAAHFLLKLKVSTMLPSNSLIRFLLAL